MFSKLFGPLVIIAYFYYGYGVYGLEHRPSAKNTVNDFLAIESGGHSGPVSQPKAGVQGSTFTTKAPTSPTQILSASTANVGTTSTTKATSSATKPTSATHSSTNKVKDLVNFYDNQGKANGHNSRPGSVNSDNNAGPKPFSYSSVVSSNKGSKNNLLVVTKSPSSPVVTSNGISVGKSDSDTRQKNKNSNGPTSTTPISYSGAVSGAGRRGSPTANKNQVATGIWSNTGQNNGNTVTTNKPINYGGPALASGKSTSRIPIPESSKKPSTPTIIGSTKPPVRSPVDASSISDSELKELSEEFLRKDTNNAAKFITLNYQGKTTSTSKNDAATLPLLSIPESVWQIPTIQTFIPLLDNYEKDTLVNEFVTPQEKAEENAFMDSIMSTAIMRRLVNFLKEKGVVTPDPKQQRDFIKQIWFNMYSRGRGKIGSSAFEHIFLSEVKNGEVSDTDANIGITVAVCREFERGPGWIYSTECWLLFQNNNNYKNNEGLHNWIYFFKEETAQRANYLGYMKILDLNNKGSVIKFHFNLQGIDKPVDSMFVGTSPELEIALYTLCFVARPDRSCPLSLAGKEMSIQTYNFRYRSKNMIGSAYPQI